MALEVSIGVIESLEDAVPLTLGDGSALIELEILDVSLALRDGLEVSEVLGVWLELTDSEEDRV